MDTASLEVILNTMSTWFALSYYIAYFLVAIATYVFMALSLYTIAKRRFFLDHRSWLAWVPFAQFWVLGSISDDYQWMVWSRKKKKRIVMLALNIIQLIAAVVIVLGLNRIIQALLNAGVTDEESLSNMLFYIQTKMDDPYNMSAVAKKLLGALTRNTNLIIMCTVVTFATAVTHAVFYYMALYDLYRSCDPGNAKVFLVLSILIGITIPFFMMICRKQDKGLSFL